jgi:hypothetical protein
VFRGDPASTALHAHIRGCEVLADFDHPGATPEQWLAIRDSGANRANGRSRHTFHSDEDEWFTIWDILFPGRARPLTPHVQCSEEVQFMRDTLRMFVEQGQPDAIADYTLPESSSPEHRALLVQMIPFYFGIYIDWVELAVNAAGQSGPQTRIQMPMRPIPSPHAGPAPLQANQHESVELDAGPV